MRLLTELVLVVSGVLIALAADGWRARASEADEERAYLGRVVEDLAADASLFRRASSAMDGKQPLLLELVALTEEEAASRPAELAADLFEATAWTWALDQRFSAAFDEMVSSGRLGRIREPDLRVSIIDYYTRREGLIGAIEARRTDFGPLVQRLARPTDAAGESEGPTHVLTHPLSASDVRSVIEQANAEFNFAVYMAAATARFASTAEQLISELRSYLGETGVP